jgi:hypothetical protein
VRPRAPTAPACRRRTQSLGDSHHINCNSVPGIMNFRSRRGSANLEFKHWCLVCSASALHTRAQSGSTWRGVTSQELMVWPCASGRSEQMPLAASQESWSIGLCSRSQNPNLIHSAVHRSFRNMSSRIAHSSPEKSFAISHQELHSRRLCLASPRPRNCTPKPLSPNKSLQRAAGHIKCSAAGEDPSSSPHRFRARVLTSQLAAAELSRWAALPVSQHD